MRKNILVLLLSFLSVMLWGQLGINILNPNPKALLHVSEKKDETSSIESRGVIIPRLTTSGRDSIKPGEEENSLLIFNTTENCYNFWNIAENEWKSICGSMGQAQFTVDCSSFSTFGTYANGQNFDETNFISIDVTVTTPGSYNIVALPQPDNGYFFYETGLFNQPGNFTIVIPGEGTPINRTPRGGEGDRVVLINNTDTICDDLRIIIEDSDFFPQFSLACTSIVVNGEYVVGRALTAQNTISVTINSTPESAGASYQIRTAPVNGYSFSGRGILTGGSQVITLRGEGVPELNGEDNFVLRTNSFFGSISCSFFIRVAARPIKIVGLANNDMSYNIGLPTNFLNRVLLQPNYFSNSQESLYPVASFEFLSLTSLTAAARTSFLNFDPDVVLVQFNYYASTAADRQFLVDYVNSGGVLIYCSDGEAAAGGARNVAARDLCQEILEVNGMTVTGADQNDLMTIQNTGNFISNGPFMNLAGLSMGRDAGGNFRFNLAGFPYDRARVIAFGDNTNTSIRAFYAVNKGFAFFGDGAPFAANAGTQAYNWPAKFTNTTPPRAIPNIYGAVPSYNSFLFLNLLAWAINYAQENR